MDSGRSCTLVVMTIVVAHSGHLYVFFICISYHDWGKDLLYRNVYLGVIHRQIGVVWYSYPQVYYSYPQDRSY